MILTSTILYSQGDSNLKNRINNHVDNQAKASKYEFTLFESLFKYNDFIEETKSNNAALDVEKIKKLNSLSKICSNELNNYKKNYESLDYTTKSLRKKHYDFFIIEADSFLQKLNKQMTELKGSESDSFDKITSSFIHQYSDLLDFKSGTRLTLAKLIEFSSFKKDGDEWAKDYLSKKQTLIDEFKIAHKLTGLIDHYSKTARYSEVFSKIQKITSNIALKTELERGIEYYKNSFNTSFDKYHTLFPDFFINTNNQISTYLNFYNSLGFILETSIQSEINSIAEKTKKLEVYKNTKEFETYCVNANKDLLNYDFMNTSDNSSPFKKYTHKKSTVNPTFLNWLKKEKSIFQIAPENYTIISIIPISEAFGRYRWGVWTEEDGTVIKNAYALKQNFIVTYKDLTSNKCFASNFTASFLEQNNVLVSNDDIKFTHTRLINCR